MTPAILVLTQLAQAGTVTLDGARWKQLLPPEEPKAEVAPGPAITWRRLSLKPGEKEILIDGVYKIHTARPGWLDVLLAGPGVEVRTARLAGRNAPIATGPDGTVLTVWVEGDAQLEVTAAASGDAARQPITLDLLDAPQGHVDVRTTRKVRLTSKAAIAKVSDTFWTGARDLSLRTLDWEKAGPKPNLVISQIGVGATLFDAEMLVKAHVRWGILHGELEEVSFDVPTAGADLQLDGPQVASWSRAGDRVTVRLRDPEDASVDVDLTWTSTVPEGDESRWALPRIRTQQTFRTERSLQLARDGEVEMVPDLDGWTATTGAKLPEWGRGLVEGSPTAAYTTTGAGEGSLGLFRFTPVSAPPTFIDVAAYDIAVTEAGRALIRAHYQVRNERGAFLRILPPPDTTIVGARVSGKTAKVGIVGKTWLIPLEKSIETVEGLLSFGVEVTLLSDTVPWQLREDRTLALPQVDVPVAVSRSTVYLPPGYQNRLAVGERSTIVSFTEGEGIRYGSALGDATAAEADALFQGAVTAWMGNDFDAVQSNLDALAAMNAENSNTDRLQANMDLISGKDKSADSGGAVALERRVKEQAKARSSRDRRAQEKVLEEAETAYLSGDYEEAEEAYSTALKLGKKLEKLEQEESVEVSEVNAMLSGQLKGAVAEKKKRITVRKDRDEEALADAPSPPAKPAPQPAESSLDAFDVPTQFEGHGGGVIGALDAGDLDGVFVGGLDANLSGGVGGLIGAKGTQIGAGELGSRGSGLGGGGTAEGLGGIGTKGIGSGRSGYGTDGGSFGTKGEGRTPNAQAGGPPDAVAAVTTAHEAPLDVRASALSVVIPSQGEAVRYQHLLLDANAPFALQIHAKKTRRP